MRKFLTILALSLVVFSQGFQANAQTVFPNRGGSGTTTITGLIRGNGTSPYTTITDGSSGQVLTTDGADGYSFQSIIKTLAAVSAASTDATKSLYTMTSTIPVEFRSSDGNPILYLDETNERIGIGTNAPSDSLSLSGNSATRIGTTWLNTNSSPSTSAFLGAYSGNMQMGTVSNHPFYLETNNTVRISIAAAGNIGIGLNSGSAKLHVLATTEQLRLGYDTSNYVPFTVSSGGLLGIIPTGGNVGIGTNTPVEKLHVSNGVNTDSGTVTFLIGGSNGANARTGRIIKDTTSPYAMTIRSGDFSGTGVGSDIKFQTNNGDGDRMVIAGGTGNVGIGVSPTHRLDAYISSSSTGVSTIYGLRNIPSGTISSGSSINGVFGQVTVSGSSTISNVIPTAGRFIAEHDGSSTVGGVYGVYAHARTNAASTGVLANAYSLYAVAPNNNQAGNTITNAYSLYIESPTAGATLNYGLYQTGSANNYFGGKVGIGTSSPSAVLHLKAGTATASTAPLKFTSGTNLTTAEAGAMEFNGTSLFFTRTGTQRETVNTTVTKTDTGDGTGAEGLFQINTFDNTFKVYAEGAWRTLATW